jgi:type I pantothenate kinase
VTASRSAYAELEALIRQRAGSVAGSTVVVGVAGGVAAGKSTTAATLRDLLSQSPSALRVDVVSADGFLFPNRVLEQRGLIVRKGFPETYDTELLQRFLAEVRAGQYEVRAPVYSHDVYDVLAGEHHLVRRPDVLILEGLHVLAFEGIDLGIYLDADEGDIEAWYVQRFLALCVAATPDSRSFFRHFAHLSPDEAEQIAHDVWRSINAVNLREHVLPTRERADVVIEKARDHSVRAVRTLGR